MVLSAGTIDWLRGLQGAFYPATCTISRYVETNTPDGVTQGWSPLASAVPCRVDTRRAIGVETANTESALRARSDWLIWVPSLTDVTERDRITIDAPDGRTFEVSLVAAKPSSYETTRAVTCTLVT